MHQLEKTMSTLEDLMAVPGDTKAELIDGEIYMMAPAVARHSSISGLLTTLLTSHFRNQRGPSDKDAWRIIPEAWTLYDVHNSFVHDIAGYSRRELPRLPNLGPIHIKPKWVCEILSRSNAKNDTERKSAILAQYSVPYYWLLDPRKKTLQVFELGTGNMNYRLVCSVKKEDGVVRLLPFQDLELDLQEIFED
ncbi:MAG: Uma2 family endonuclease [Myxococcaceae bacterium]